MKKKLTSRKAHDWFYRNVSPIVIHDWNEFGSNTFEEGWPRFDQLRNAVCHSLQQKLPDRTAIAVKRFELLLKPDACPMAALRVLAAITQPWETTDATDFAPADEVGTGHVLRSAEPDEEGRHAPAH